MDAAPTPSGGCERLNLHVEAALPATFRPTGSHRQRQTQPGTTEMTTDRMLTLITAGLLAVGFATTTVAQTTDDHAAHQDETATEAPAAAPMPGMGMMGPEMMRMMQGMMGQGRMAMADGMMPCPMMAGAEARPMGAMMGGAGLLLGAPAPQEMTPERVRSLLEERLAWLGNPRLELGEIAPAEDGSIVAEIRTVDGSLVQRLAFNRYPGLARMLVE